MKDSKKLIDDTLIFIAQKGWALKGQSFYDSLALFLGENLAMTYVLIDKLGKDDGSVETVASVAHGAIFQNVAYPLTHTPCENVIGKNLLSI